MEFCLLCCVSGHSRVCLPWHRSGWDLGWVVQRSLWVRLDGLLELSAGPVSQVRAPPDNGGGLGAAFAVETTQVVLRKQITDVFCFYCILLF